MIDKPRAYEYAGLVGNYLRITQPSPDGSNDDVVFESRCVQIEDTSKGLLFIGQGGDEFLLKGLERGVTRFVIWAPSFTQSGHPTSIRRVGTSTGRLRTSGPPEYWQDMRPDA